MTKKDKVKELWNLSFQDSKEFTELYFKERYTDDNTVILEDGTQMTAMLQLLPYPFKFLKQTVDTRYISGACTHPNFRNKGVMHKLLLKSFKHLQENNIPLCTLIPAEEWLFDYYRKSGFETVFYNSSYHIEVPKYDQDSNVVVTFNDEFNEDSYSYIHAKMKKRSASILHTIEDFKVILADLRLANGQVFTARIKREVVGVALAYFNQQDQVVYINEILSRDICINQELFESISQYYGSKHIAVIIPSLDEKKEKLGMLRIIQAKTILDIFAKAKPDWETSFYLEDSLIPSNQGLYVIKDGVVSFKKTTQTANHPLITINELAIQLFEPLDPYMSLMLN